MVLVESKSVGLDLSHKWNQELDIKKQQCYPCLLPSICSLFNLLISKHLRSTVILEVQKMMFVQGQTENGKLMTSIEQQDSF